jgi:hypothetical protein
MHSRKAKIIENPTRARIQNIYYLKTVKNKRRRILEYPNKTFFRNIPGSAEII